MGAFIRWLAGRYLLVLVFLATFVVAGLVGVFLSGYVIESLELDDDFGMYVKLVSFLIIIGALGWGYDKYKEWRFFRDD